MRTAQLTIDLNSVSHIQFFYRNQNGIQKAIKPTVPTVDGKHFSFDQYAFPYLTEYPKETKLERARRLDILDVWKPVCVYQFRNNHSITFEGALALKRRDAYNKHIFNRNK